MIHKRTECKNWVCKNKCLVIVGIVTVIYFLLMLRFYLIDYYVPDFRLYASWPLAEYTAIDGYSSLFIQICGLIAIAPRQMTILCLVLLALSLFVMVLAAYNMLYKDNAVFFWLSVAVLYSASIWYYFYGKIFYDFPFTAFSYSILFLMVSRTYTHIQGGQRSVKDFYYISILSGFVMSWKMYNIFAVAGLGLLF